MKSFQLEQIEMLKKKVSIWLSLNTCKIKYLMPCVVFLKFYQEVGILFETSFRKMQFVSIASATSNWIKILSFWKEKTFFSEKRFSFSFPGESLIEHEIAKQRELKFQWFDKRKAEMTVFNGRNSFEIWIT